MKRVFGANGSLIMESDLNTSRKVNFVENASMSIAALNGKQFYRIGEITVIYNEDDGYITVEATIGNREFKETVNLNEFAKVDKRLVKAYKNLNNLNADE